MILQMAASLRNHFRFLHGAFRQLQGRNDPDPKYSAFVISSTPIVLRIGFCNYWKLFPLFEKLRDRRVYILFRFTWQFETQDRLNKLIWETRKRLNRYPNHFPIFLCNARREVEGIRASGLEAHHINNNCFVDPELYRADPAIPKRYDAIYDAKLDPYKRHELAAKIKSIALVTYIDGDARANAHACEIRRRLSHAVWHNDPFSDKKKGWIDDQEIPRLYSEARVGLALSAEEGQMFASIQYLLVGLPVVSTPSLGGRDYFFDEEFARVVDADPYTVAEAVAEFVKTPPDPIMIRQRTITKMMHDRQKFVELVQSIYDREGIRRSYADEFSKNFYNRFMSYNPKSKLLRELGISERS